jgi:hypothetical protein
MSSCCCCPDNQPLQFGDLTSDEFCGNFDLPCKKDPVTVWSLDHTLFDANAQTAATVSVYYDSGCGDSVKVLVERKDGTFATLEVDKLNTRSITILNIISVKIQCSEGSNRCKGKYCINLHYDVLVTPGV